MIRPLLEFFFLIVFLIWVKYADANLQAELYGMSIGLAAALLIEFFTWLYKERQFLKLFWDCFKPF